ncbi:MAG TPA: VCBS repeat-containing protein [Actinomycetota bacterium]|nr:VCBS repeat-containing protein [Actinomycetota bacterium]
MTLGSMARGGWVSRITSTTAHVAAPTLAAILVVASTPATASHRASIRFGAPVVADDVQYTVSTAIAPVLGDDRRPDVLVTGLELGRGCYLLAYRQRRNGSLRPPRHLPVRCSHGADVSTGDIDGDRDVDVAVTAWEGILLLKQRAGRLRDRVMVPIEVGDEHAAPYIVEIADLDRDGRRDLVTSTTDGVFVLYNRRAAFDTVQIDPNYQFALVVHDVTGDRRLDIIGCGDDIYTNCGRLNVFEQRADGTFAEEPYEGIPPQYRSFDAIAAGDVTGDGRADLVVTLDHDRPLNIVPQLPSGDLGERIRLDIAVNAQSVAIRDMNLDGLKDIVLVHSGNGSRSSARLGVVLQLPQGQGWSRERRFEASGWAYHLRSTTLAIGQLNRDRHPDAAFADGEFLAVFQQE